MPNTTTNETTGAKATILARFFLSVPGAVYAVLVPGCRVAQGVFRSKAAATKMASRIGGRIARGEFDSNGDIVLEWDSERAEAQAEINSRDRMAAARQRIETRRAPGW